MAYRDDAYIDRDSGSVPDIVKQFVVYLYRHIRERNVPEIKAMYETSFQKLSDRFYKDTPWPPAEAIEDLVDQDHVFCLLYKEMYYRHLYARTTPSLRARCESWDNYCELFGVILRGNVNMVLPVVWLWEIVDEFLYQFQSFCQYRVKLSQKSAEEIALLKQCKVWSTLDVLNALQALVDMSGIVPELKADGGVGFADSDGYYAAGKSNVLRCLGYFSLVGLLRVHCLIGDYQTGLQALYPLNLFERGALFTPKLPSCHISLFYYAGFAYLMLRRYTDAGRCFNGVLAYINRVKQHQPRNSTYDQMLRKNEQMYALLALVVALCPAVQKGLDEHVLAGLKEKHADDLQRMSRGEEALYDKLFSYGCPKFITASTPDYENPSAGTGQEAYRRQLSLFLKEVSATTTLPLLKQYLLLYSSIALEQLASLTETEPAGLRQALLCLKNKNFCLQWSGGADMTSGTFANVADLDFCIDIDPATGVELVIMNDAVHTRHHADLLARHIVKFEEIVRDLEAAPAAAAAPPAPRPGHVAA